MSDVKPKHVGVSVFDLDGCVFDDRHRHHLKPSARQIEKAPAQAWEHYNHAYNRDVPNPEGARRLMATKEAGVLICIITARPVSMFHETIDQIQQHFGLSHVDDFLVMMRKQGDFRSSVEFKKESIAKVFMDAEKAGHDFFQAFDDKPEVVSMYKDWGVVNAHILAAGQPCNAPEIENLVELAKLTPKFDDPAEAFFEAISDGLKLAEGPATGSWDIRGRLEASALEFQERAERYARNDLMYGQVMAILFPNGMKMRTPEDHRLGMFIMHVVGKLTRLAASGFAHDDSAKDLIAYVAMVQDTLETGRVV